MQRRSILGFLCGLFAGPSEAQNVAVRMFEPFTRRWELDNGSVRAVFELTSDGAFNLQEFGDASGSWAAPPHRGSTPIFAVLGGKRFDDDTRYWHVRSSVEPIPRGKRLVVVLQDTSASAEFTLEYEMYEEQVILRQQVTLRNLQRSAADLVDADFLTYRFQAPSDALDVFHIDQWDPTTTTSFQLHRELLGGEDQTIQLRTGADARDIAWYAFRDNAQLGMFAGLEFNGRAQVSLQRFSVDGSVRLSAQIPGLFHSVAPGKTFALPAAFLGLFHGDWDEAGYHTQRFLEAHIAQPQPPDFPWVSWDSWGYGLDIDEQILRANAEVAARLGMELFVVDLGWARHIGEWTANPAKFPRGLRDLSDLVHSLGMKFGLHFAPAEAAPEAQVLREHPEWTSSETDWYFGAVSLCLGNHETREWVVSAALRMIDDYKVDYIVQDGENMVKRCRRTNHSHHPLDSNYSNSVEGIDWVVREIQRLRPQVLWENCEDGGHMMTFQMPRLYVTSITNDATGALDARKGTWGATYPFTPRYTSRYMPENPSSVFLTRSHMFGGPWHMMNRLTEMPAADAALVTQEIRLYKRIRPILREARVYHLIGDPQPGSIDAIEGYNHSLDAAVIVVTRQDSPEGRVIVRPQGLRPEGTYKVSFADIPRQELRIGRQLADTGIELIFFESRSAEVIFIESVS